MAELALYRKYRSNNFAEVIGQSHVVDTLTNALSTGRISHAYLFTGPRGVGKTTVARLLAKGVNCLKTTKPCNICKMCRIDLESNLDLIEIDAASNRRIDEIRDLKEKINLAPTQAKYKVYIIDEVHMLTTEAFNALLKTLEEPPAHALFILATTEAHKLPATIISRTQRFNFKPINQEDIVARLKAIAIKEKIKIDLEAIELLAIGSNGSLRDAISMLDQIASYSQDHLDGKKVRAILGWSDNETVRELSLAMSEGNSKKALEIIDRLAAAGIQPGQIILQLITYWRSVTLNLLAIGTNSSGYRQKDLVTNLDLTTVSSILETLLAASRSNLPQLALETAVIKLALFMDNQAPEQSNAKHVKSVSTEKPNEMPSSVVEKMPKETKPDIMAINADEDQIWHKALFVIKEHNNSLYALLRSSKVEVGENLTVTCKFNFHRQRLEESKNREIIERALKQVYGKGKKLIIKQETSNIIDNNNSATELVSTAMEILGGELVDE